MNENASNMDEARLIAGLKQKGEEAFRALIDMYSEKLYQLSLSVLGGQKSGREEEARDVLQEVFSKVITHIGTFQGGSSLYTWLYRITLNEALMKRRGRQKHPEESFDELLPKYEFGYLAEDTRDWSRAADDRLEDEEFRELIRTSVDQLPEPLKTAYILKDIEELPEDQVCEILELTKPAMKNRVHRARLILRKRIEEAYASA